MLVKKSIFPKVLGILISTVIISFLIGLSQKVSLLHNFKFEYLKKNQHLITSRLDAALGVTTQRSPKNLFDSPIGESGINTIIKDGMSVAWKLYENEILALQKYRMRTFSKFCKRYQVFIEKRGCLLDGVVTRAFIDKGFCVPNKVASTSWLAFFKKQIWSHSSNTTLVSVWNKTVSGLRSRKLISPKYVWETFKVQVLIARNPWARLLSAYKNKCEGTSYFDKWLGKPAIPCANHSFPGFVDIVVDEHQKNHVDGHWRPISRVCQACCRNYTYIGKYETMFLELPYLLDLFGIPLTRLKEFGHLNPSEKRKKLSKNDKALLKKSNTHLTPYKDLSKTQLGQLRSMYSMDMNLFEYPSNPHELTKTDYDVQNLQKTYKLVEELL